MIELSIQKSSEKQLFASSTNKGLLNYSFILINLNSFALNYIVTLNEILGYEQNCQSIINNIPPLLEEDFYLKYNIDENSRHNLYKCGNKLFQLMDGINNYFIELKSEISKEIEKANQLAQEKLKIFYREYQKIFQVYEEISRIDEFKQILIRYDIKNQKDLKTFINEYFQNRAANQEDLQKKIQRFEYIFGEIEFSQPLEIKNLLNSSIQSIDFFNNLNRNNNLQLTEAQNKSANFQHVQDIYNLISNSTNFCRQQFLNQFKDFSQKYKYLIQSFPFDQNKQDEIKSKRYCTSLGNINEDIFQKLSVFSEVIEQVDKILKIFLEAELSKYLNSLSTFSFSEQYILHIDVNKAHFLQTLKNQINVLPYVNFKNSLVAGELSGNLLILYLNKSIHYKFKLRVFNFSMSFQNNIQLAQHNKLNLIPIHIFYLNQQNIQQYHQNGEGKNCLIQDLSIEIYLEKCLYQISDMSNSKLQSSSQITLNCEYALLFHLLAIDDYLEIKQVNIKL
ncbi:hypothetical protein ABPG72_000692 [Tetrahymena utriculariae]